MERVSGAALRFVCVYVCRATRVEKSEEKNEKMGGRERGGEERKEKDETRDKRGEKKRKRRGRTRTSYNDIARESRRRWIQGAGGETR